MKECEHGKHKASWMLTLPRVPVVSGEPLTVMYVGCEACKTAVAGPEDQSRVSEEGGAYIKSMLDRMGVTARTWKGDPNGN